MSATAALAAEGLTKRHGSVPSLDEASFEVARGRITGLLGPNGAGKSTALRLLVGLDRPSAGRALVDGRPLAAWPEPARKVGAALGVRCAHPGRTARDSLRWVATLAGVPWSRCDDLLEQVGLAEAAGRRTRGFSLGMRQRLALAIALVPDPEVLVLDEPMNGLDPEGIAWTKRLLRGLRAEGRTVLFSTHLLAEAEDLVDDLVVLARGRVVDTGPVAAFLERHQRASVAVRCDDPARLLELVRQEGGQVLGVDDQGRMELSGLDADRVGRLAGAAGIAVLELTARRDLHGAFDAATRLRPAPEPLRPILDGAAR